MYKNAKKALPEKAEDTLKMDEDEFDISQVKVAINTLLFTYLHDQVTLKELEELSCHILYKMEELHENAAQRATQS